MIRTMFRVAACAALLALAACASQGGRLVSAGPGIRVFDMQVDTTMDWARIRLPRTEFWTIDGLPLNEFVVVSAVKPNEHVFLGTRERKRRPDGPWYRPGMRPDEVRDIILDGLREDGWTNVEVENLRPARFGTIEGLRFEATLTHPGGLHYRAKFGAVQRNGRLTHFFWMAPGEHYYPRDEAAVARMFDSIRFVD